MNDTTYWPWIDCHGLQLSIQPIIGSLAKGLPFLGDYEFILEPSVRPRSSETGRFTFLANEVNKSFVESSFWAMTSFTMTIFRFSICVNLFGYSCWKMMICSLWKQQDQNMKKIEGKFLNCWSSFNTLNPCFRSTCLIRIAARNASVLIGLITNGLINSSPWTKVHP